MTSKAVSFIRFFLVAFVAITSTYSSNARAGSPADEAAVNWAVTRMVSWSPPGKSYYVNAKETESDGRERYAAIAKDAISVAFDPDEAPLFAGPRGRYKTLAIMLSVADSESGFRKDVDFGIGKESKGDGGRSWCMAQVQLGKAVGGKTKTRVVLDRDGLRFVWDGTGYGGEDLVSDRKKCFRVGLHIMRMSFNTCSSLPLESRLSMYASGSCGSGRDASANRVRKAVKWLSASAPPTDDADLMLILGSDPAKEQAQFLTEIGVEKGLSVKD